jgi:hypothetical protein
MIFISPLIKEVREVAYFDIKYRIKKKINRTIKSSFKRLHFLKESAYYH